MIASAAMNARVLRVPPVADEVWTLATVNATTLNVTTASA